MSERPDLTARDLHPVPAELSYDEAVEALVLCAAVISQEPQRLLLGDEEAADAVGTVVHTGGVASERDVAGQLVDLVAEGETWAPPGLQRGAVCRGLDRPRQDVIRIEESLENSGARARIAGMGGRVRRVRGTSLGENDGQQACPML